MLSNPSLSTALSTSTPTPRPKNKSPPSRTSHPPTLFHRRLPPFSLPPRLFRTLIPESPSSRPRRRRHLSPIHAQPALPSCCYRYLRLGLDLSLSRRRRCCCCRGVVVVAASNDYSPPPLAFPTFVRCVNHVLLYSS